MSPKRQPADSRRAGQSEHHEKAFGQNHDDGGTCTVLGQILKVALPTGNPSPGTTRP